MNRFEIRGQVVSYGTTKNREWVEISTYDGSITCYLEGIYLKAAVIFPERNTWASLLSDYEQLKSMLTKKYGEPAMDMEYFTGSVTENDSDALKMSALDKDEIMWFTIYSSNLGNIELSIVSSSPGEGVVRMMYSDLNIIESMK